jgi:hypothetical protein
MKRALLREGQEHCTRESADWCASFASRVGGLRRANTGCECERAQQTRGGLCEATSTLQLTTPQCSARGTSLTPLRTSSRRLVPTRFVCLIPLPRVSTHTVLLLTPLAHAANGLASQCCTHSNDSRATLRLLLFQLTTAHTFSFLTQPGSLPPSPSPTHTPPPPVRANIDHNRSSSRTLTTFQQAAAST